MSSSNLYGTIVSQISALEQFASVKRAIESDNDCQIAIPSIARPAYIATFLARTHRPILVIAESEDHAEKLRIQLAALLPAESLELLPANSIYPWEEKVPDLPLTMQRARALNALSGLSHTHSLNEFIGTQANAQPSADSSDLEARSTRVCSTTFDERVSGARINTRPVVVIASIKALMQKILPPDLGVYTPLEFIQGEELDITEVTARLTSMGYERTNLADSEATFTSKGDVIHIHPPLGSTPIRIDFFGDEIESIKRFVPTSGQVLGEVRASEIYPLRELPLGPETTARAKQALDAGARRNPAKAYHLDLLKQGIAFNGMERYIPLLYPEAASASSYLPPHGMAAIVEPKILFDLAVRTSAELEEAASTTGDPANLDNYLKPSQLDFGAGTQLTFLSLLRAQPGTETLRAKRPKICSSDTTLTAEIRAYCNAKYRTIIAVPQRTLREKLTDLLVDAGIPLGDEAGQAQLIDAEVPSGFVIDAAKLAVISQAEAYPRSVQSRSKQRTIDPTKVTFPFQPGDYVVHSSYGVALFKRLTRRSVDGIERDYLQLEYAMQDTLYTPVEQIDKVSKYVGSEAGAPKITRLGNKSWQRAKTKAKAAAKALAFDLVNLYARRSQAAGFQYGADTPDQQAMEASFPYTETPDQASAIADIKADMESQKPMDRLICGDVGYGKTEVAVRAAFKAVKAGKQVMVLCPTTILAQQHFTTFADRFAPYDIDVEVLSRFRTPAQQKVALAGFADGSVSILVGTHRLLSKDIIPHDLGLLVIDEEQRFGVGAKEQLKNIREQIDVLAMSATPIPRTLQMSLSGVRDLSVIDTPPENRHPIRVHVGMWEEDIVADAIREELHRGGQVYYVSNRVHSINDARLRVEIAAPEARVGIAHGQMTSAQLETVMEEFAAGTVDVLVATTIIESGIDNPHSNTLIIEDSQRLGLAQLYQLKGRVGRSHTHAYAYFLYPEHAELTPEAKERLAAIAKHDTLGSGIKIAMRDLEIRGAGSLIGAEQSGQMSAVGFDLFASMISEAIAEARGQEVAAFPEIRIELDTPAFIAEEYIADIGSRVLMYRRLAAMTTTESFDEVVSQVHADFGAPPREAQNLIDMMRVKILAANVGATAVQKRGATIQIRIPSLSDELTQEMHTIGATYDRRSAILTWKMPLRKTTLEAAHTLLSAMVFHTD